MLKEFPAAESITNIGTFVERFAWCSFLIIGLLVFLCALVADGG
jgi:hypothetical protein